MMKKTEYIVPNTLEEALLELQKTGGRIIAGGTDICVLIEERIITPETLVDVGLITELQYREEREEYTALGAGSKIAEIARAGDLPAALTQGAGAIGSPQIRNLATLGGNICNASPCGDTLAPLVAMEAEFVLRSAEGERIVEAENFFTGPKKTVLRKDEILTEVRLRREFLQGKSSFRKIGKRKGQVISQVNAAVWLKLEGDRFGAIRAAVGSVAPVPLRLLRLEEALSGTAVKSISKEQIDELVNREIMPIDDVRASESYRRNVAGVLIYDALQEAIG